MIIIKYFNAKYDIVCVPVRNFMGAPAPGAPMLPMPVTRIIHHSSLNDRIASLVNNNYMILVILVWGTCIKEKVYEGVGYVHTSSAAL